MQHVGCRRVSKTREVIVSSCGEMQQWARREREKTIVVYIIILRRIYLREFYRDRRIARDIASSRRIQARRATETRLNCDQTHDSPSPHPRGYITIVPAVIVLPRRRRTPRIFRLSRHKDSPEVGHHWNVLVLQPPRGRVGGRKGGPSGLKERAIRFYDDDGCGDERNSFRRTEIIIIFVSEPFVRSPREIITSGSSWRDARQKCLSASLPL